MLSMKLKAYFFIFTLYITALFGTLFMMFPCLLLLFFNRFIFHKLVNFFLGSWFALAVYLIEKFLNIQICLHLKNVKDLASLHGNSIVIMNHRTRLDWLFYFCVLYRLDSLKNIKIILKNDLRKIIGPSWAMQFGLFIFLNRKWELDRTIITKFIKYYKTIDEKVLVLLFPEGTNLTKNTIKKSNEYAAANNLDFFQNVLHPRNTGFTHLVKEMSTNNIYDSIQDITIAYSNNIPENELDFLNGAFPKQIHFYLDYYPCSTKILNDNWLLERWKLKESLLEKFNNRPIDDNDKFCADSILEDKKILILYLYVLYWIASMSFIFYITYNYYFIKFYILIAVILLLIIEKFYTGIDHYIMRNT